MEPEQNCSYLDEFRIVETLGEGYHACVLKGIGKNDEVVAIKRYRKQSADLSTLKHELSIMLELNHENLARVIEARKSAMFQGTDGKSFECFAIILEHIGGGELFDYIATPGTGKFSEKVSRTYFSQLMNALYYLHNKGYAHRDIKPENILMTSDFILKLSDFGFSAKLEGHDMSGVLRTNLGSEGYKAPEIYAKKYNGVKTDLFAAGVILFIMYSGSPPFESAGPSDRVYNLIKKDNWKVFWNAHSKRKPQGFFTDQFKDLFEKMVSANPDNRIPIEQIAQHPWIKQDLSSHEEIIKEFSERKSKIDAEKDAKKKEEEQMKKNRQTTGEHHRGDGTEDKEFQEQYAKLLKCEIDLKTIDQLGKEGFYLNEKIQYALPALTTYLNKFELPLEDIQEDPDALEKPDVPIFKQTEIKIEGSKIKATFECEDVVETDDGEEEEFKNVVTVDIEFGVNSKKNLAVQVTRAQGDYFYYKRIAGEIKNQFLYCLV